MNTMIVYEDAHILIAYKPAGFPTQSGRIGQADMVSELKNYLKKSNGQPYLGVIHRLDQPVEGLLVFAKTKEAAAGLTRQLSQGMLNKQYYAVTCGQPVADEGMLVDYMIKTPDNRAEIVTGEAERFSGEGSPGARRAVLHYRVISRISTPEPLCFLDIHIETGRFHQIRAQMAHAGFSLLGDRKYANQGALAVSERMNVRNVALCAYRIALKHPISKKELFFQIEPKGSAFRLFDRKAAK